MQELQKFVSLLNKSIKSGDFQVHSEDLYLPMISGWLLDYPGIYCNSGKGKEVQSNCLSMVSLHVYRVHLVKKWNG